MAYNRASVMCRAHPDAVLVEDHRAGDMICSSCGLVVGDRVVDVSQEWRTFSDSNNDPSRVGASENPLLDGELSTIIGAASGPAGLDEHGNPRYRNRSNMSSEHRTLTSVFKYIDEVGDKGQLSRTILEQAKLIYKQAHDADKDKVGNRHRHPVAAAALFIACRNEMTGRSYKELSAISGVPVKKLTRSIAYIEKVTGRRGETTTSATFLDSFMPRMSSHLSLDGEISKIAIQIATKANDVGVTLGRSHTSVAAASLHLTLLAMDIKRPLKDICEHLGCAEGTLKQVYRIIVPHASELWPAGVQPKVPLDKLPQL